MYNYQYVSKKTAAPVKNELISILNQVQDIVRDDFTFKYTFIGSSSRNMITCFYESNIGFDFDINIQPNLNGKSVSAKQIKNKIMVALNEVLVKHRYECCEDSTRVITIKVVDKEKSKILHSCDIAIVRDEQSLIGGVRQQYIRFNKSQNSYTWEYQPQPYDGVDSEAEWLKHSGYWGEVRDIYLNKKRHNSSEKASRSLYAETIHEVYEKHGSSLQSIFANYSPGKENRMKNSHAVSGNTHTQAQLNNYANQHNPNNSAFRANQNNHANQCNPNNREYKGSSGSKSSKGK